MKRKTIFGPPGTGKTTYLMNLILKELKTVEPNKIAFVSYTKQGTYEGAKRAQKKFGFNQADMPFFRTIHSLCFRELGMRKYDMIQQKHYKTFSEKMGIPFTGYYTQDYNSPNDEYLHAISMERHNPELALKMSRDMDANKYEYIKFNYSAIKNQLGIKDFDDLLEDYISYCKPFDLEVAFIDEGQDLTPLQWRVVLHMFKNVKRIYVAGDDDQSVYEWAGADTKQFLNFSKESLVLNKSYRLPNVICKMAHRISDDIGIRKDKEFLSNGEDGVIDRAENLINVDFKGGELILARTNYKLRQLCEELKLIGVYFVRKGYACVEPQTIQGVNTYKQFMLGEKEVRDVKKFGNLFRKIDKDTEWQRVLNKPQDQVAFIERLFENGGLEKKPVLLETFHSSKGTENDHVIISPDLSARVSREFHEQRDSELRCLYVGMTRTKNKLTLLSPQWKNAYPDKYFSLPSRHILRKNCNVHFNEELL